MPDIIQTKYQGELAAKKKEVNALNREIERLIAEAHIKIPMLGKLDSLNVSVSAAILLFEAVRQRNS